MAAAFGLPRVEEGSYVRELFGVVVDPYGLKVLKFKVIGFENAAAVEAFDVINAISPRQNLDSFVLANNGLHMDDTLYSSRSGILVKT